MPDQNKVVLITGGNRGIGAVTAIHTDSGDPNRAQRLQHQVPMQRTGSALEVAGPIVWLLSAEASYVNGALLDVSGGR